MKTTLRNVIGLALTFQCFDLLAQASPADFPAQLAAVERTTPTPAAVVPRTGQFYSARLANEGLILAPILPGGMNLPAWDLGNNVWLVNDLEPVTPLRNGMQRMALDGGPLPPGASGGNGATNTYMFNGFYLDTNRLWLELTNIVNGVGYANLHRATNFVYVIKSAEDLLTPAADWRIETEVFPADTNCQPFTIATLNRPTLFLKAEDFSGLDSDADGVPDWWAWLYWATTNVPAGTDFYNGQSFADDFSNDISPTVFRFTGIEVTNHYVSSGAVPAQLDVTGSPYYLAISLDDSNYLTSGAWTEYASSNITVNLGLTEGWHDVRAGLRGHGDAPTNAVWQYQHLKLDFTPPALVITSPTNHVVSVPVLQLTGYSSEALSSIRYALTNAAGTFTNEPVFVIGQGYDTNTWEFTTNTFQAFDLSLTTGLNHFTFYAVDEANNVTMTNFNVTLDYSAKTNPPAVQLYWPQDGNQISGTNFLVCGRVDDTTVKISAQIVDGNNNTNFASGAVGRDGIFWLQNLPLNTPTNTLTLTVQDVVGNTTVTNLTLRQSGVALTLNPATAGATSVSGTIDASGYKIWVNGTNAVQPGNGTWHATLPAMTGASGMIEATAIPNSDNGGNGSGSDAAGNPLSAQSKNAAAAVPAPSGIHYASYHYHLHREIPASSAVGDWTVDWADGAASTQKDETWNWSDGHPHIYGLYQWPPVSWPQGPAYLGTKISYIDAWATNVYSGSAPLRFEYTRNLTETHNPLNIDYGALGEKVSMDEQVDLLLATGGDPGSTTPRLWSITPSTPNYSFWTGNYEYWTGNTVPPSQITIGTFGPLDTNGLAYAVLPDNTNVDITPVVKNLDWYAFNLHATAYTLTHTTECTAAGNPDNARTTIGIGEVVDLGGMPDNTVWSVSGGGTLSATNGGSTVYTAPLSPTTATIIATVETAQLSVTFNVIPPSGIGNVSVYQDVGWGATGTNGIGAQTIFWFSVLPTDVSFAHVQFRENIPTSSTNTWPNGFRSYSEGKLVPFGAEGNCDSVNSDTIGDPPRPASRLYNGTNYVNFSYSLTWADEYLNADGNWVSFVTMHTTTEYRGSDLKCREIYQGVSGSWQGPWGGQF
jgi:hypothetical protein